MSSKNCSLAYEDIEVRHNEEELVAETVPQLNLIVNKKYNRLRSYPQAPLTLTLPIEEVLSISGSIIVSF